jgi:hypothetical protein
MSDYRVDDTGRCGGWSSWYKHNVEEVSDGAHVSGVGGHVAEVEWKRVSRVGARNMTYLGFSSAQDISIAAKTGRIGEERKWGKEEDNDMEGV